MVAWKNKIGGKLGRRKTRQSPGHRIIVRLDGQLTKKRTPLAWTISELCVEKGKKVEHKTIARDRGRHTWRQRVVPSEDFRYPSGTRDCWPKGEEKKGIEEQGRTRERRSAVVSSSPRDSILVGGLVPMSPHLILSLRPSVPKGEWKKTKEKNRKREIKPGKESGLMGGGEEKEGPFTTNAQETFFLSTDTWGNRAPKIYQ